MRALVLFAVLHASTALSIEAEQFFTEPDMLRAQVNPDGTRIAALYGTGEDQRLDLLTPRGKILGTLVHTSELASGEGAITGLSWVDAGMLAVQFTEIRQGVADLLDTRLSRELVLLSLQDGGVDNTRILTVRTGGWMVDPLANEPNHFLFAKSSRRSRVYRVDARKLDVRGTKITKLSRPDGGQFIKQNEVTSVNGYALRWFLDADAIPRAVLAITAPDSMQLFSLAENGGTSHLKSWNTAEFRNRQTSETGERLLLPIALADSSGVFYCLDLAEEKERSVYRVDYSTGEETLVFQADDAQIVNLIVDQESGHLDGVEVLEAGILRLEFIGDDNKARDASASPRIWSITDAPPGSPFSIVYVEAHDDPGSIYSLDSRSGDMHYLGSTYPHIRNRLDATLVLGTNRVGELDIPYLLSLPGENRRHPLVVFPHGGPIGIFDTPYFDSLTQFLVANGYAVLRVNFRGSGGHGDELEQAGTGEWGGMILEDIVTATRQAIRRDDIDGGRVCVFGNSYGGYAAYMLALKYPDIFACAVSGAAISDLPLYANSSAATDSQRAWLKEQLGDPEGNYDALKAISPAYLAGDFSVPLLIVHGAQDDVVEVEHAYRMKLMLEKHGKPFSWHIFEDQDHDFDSASEQAQWMRIVNDFLKQHLAL